MNARNASGEASSSGFVTTMTGSAGRSEALRTTTPNYPPLAAPARAIRCGQSIIDVLAQRGISVHAGVHTGECERPRR